MANKLYEEDDVREIAAAIRRKNGLSNTYTVAQMAPAIDALVVGRSVVNGIVEQYKASSSTIAADTFVEFVNDGDFGTGVGENTSFGVNTVSGVYDMSAVQLDTNKVAVFYIEQTNNQAYLSGVICTISGTTITLGTPTQISTQLLRYIAAVKIGTDKVFVAHGNTYISNPEGSDNQLYGIVCTISGTTITAGTDTQLASCDRSGQYISISCIEDDKVFITHMGGCLGFGYTTVALESLVCTVSGTTITKGTAITLSSTASVSAHNSSVVIDTNKVFVSYSETSNNHLYGVVCTISGTTVTKGTPTEISSNSNPGYYNKVALADATNKVFITHRSNGNLYGIVCTISGTTITAGTDTQLANEYGSTSLAYIKPGVVFVTHKSGNYPNYYTNGLTCTVSGTTITTASDVQLTDIDKLYEGTTTALVDTEKVIVVSKMSTSPYSIYGTVVTKGQTVVASSTKIDGLTKTECTTSVAGDVWVLNTGN